MGRARRGSDWIRFRGRKKSKFETYLPIMDKLCAELSRHVEANYLLGFLDEFPLKTNAEIKEAAQRFRKDYPEDIELEYFFQNWDSLLVFLFALCCLLHMVGSLQPPNIVFIVADDLGWDDVGFHGSEIDTPNIDALASSGIILNQYYVSPICSPTRSALMTGRHPIHTGMQVYVIEGATPYGLPLNETTMAQHFQTLGYRRHIVGKWHLGFFQEPYIPTNRGFESHFGYYTGREDYFDHQADDNFWGLDFHRNGQTLWNVTGNFSTEMYTSEAEKIIRAHNKSEPLFLYLAHQAVHAGNSGDPLQVPQSYVNRFKNKIKDIRRRIFAGMVSALDDSVGHIVKVLEETSMINNTIIIFSTDNGGPTNGYDGNAACNWPLRGVKNTLWEGGVRGVGFLNSPLLGNVSYTSENLFHVTDWLPTLYRAAGGDPTTLSNLDGYDMWDMLRKNGPQIRMDVLHNIDPVNKFAAIRVGDFKLIQGHISNNDNGWYPPPQLFYKVSNDGVQKESLEFLPEFEIYSDKYLSSNQEYFVSLYSERETKADLRSNTVHYKQTGHDTVIKVQCGPKPLNASFNCLPETAPCLFYIPTDPCEYNNLAPQYMEKVLELTERLLEYAKTMVAPGNKPADPNANPSLHGGDWKPWM